MDARKEEVAASGEIEYPKIFYKFITSNTNGGENISRGKYLGIWTMQADGTCNLIWEINALSRDVVNGLMMSAQTVYIHHHTRTD